LASDSAGRVSFFASTVPGLGGLLKDETAARPGLEAGSDVGADGRSDVVFFRIRRGARFALDELRLAEDVFVIIGDSGRGPPGRLAAALVEPAGLERALSVRAGYVRPLSGSMTFRVISRVLDESEFRRTDLRGAVERAIGAVRPRWRAADPADLEVWVVEYRRGRFVSGVRLSDRRLRQHGAGRVSERRGALRPAVAAAMVRLAGAGPGRLLDPCCGSGTIVREAGAAGWDAQGSDLDEAAVRAARVNVPGAVIERADARKLPQPDGAFDAVVTNLPFGRQFRVGGDTAAWVTGVLREAARVIRPGGRVIVLVPPPVPDRIGGLTLAAAHPLRLLGVPTQIWAYDRDRPR